MHPFSQDDAGRSVKFGHKWFVIQSIDSATQITLRGPNLLERWLPGWLSRWLLQETDYIDRDWLALAR